MVNKKMEKYQWAVGVVVITVIFVLIITFVLLIPSFKSLGKVNKEVKAKKADLNILEKKLTKLKELKVKENDLKEQEKVVNGAIPTKKEVGGLFIQLEKIMTDTGASTTGITEQAQVVSSSPTDGANPSAASTEVVGISSVDYGGKVVFPSYDSFKNFLSLAEQARQFISLNIFIVNDTEDGTFAAELNYKAYYRGQPNESDISGQQTGGQSQ